MVPEIPLKIGNCQNNMAASLFQKKRAWNHRSLSKILHRPVLQDDEPPVEDHVQR